MVKNFFLISNLDLPSFRLEPFPLGKTTLMAEEQSCLPEYC